MMKSSLQAFLRVLLAPIAAALFLWGCVEEPGEQVFESNEASDSVRIELAPDTSASKALALFKGASGNPELRVGIAWSDHGSYWELSPGTPEDQLAELIKAEENLLRFLISNFNPEDKMEAPIHAELTVDLEDLLAHGDPKIDYVVAFSEHVPSNIIENNLVVSIRDVEAYRAEAMSASVASDDRFTVAEQAIIEDFTGDASYNPYYGTSTVYGTGSLQKFWLDNTALSALRSGAVGFEVKTLVQRKDWAQCKRSGWGSNLPGKYYDTELGDDADAASRVCSIGTVFLGSVRPNTMYWTWQPLSSFRASYNPQIYIQWAPKTWCWWTVSDLQGIAAPAYHTCNFAGMPIEWLVGYKYRDAPGREVSYIMN